VINKIILKNLVAVCLIFIYGNVFSDNCTVDKAHVYNIFKKYRTALYDEVADPSNWFSEEFNKKYIVKIQNSSLDERDASLNLYDFNLQAGKLVRTVYSYDMICKSDNKIDLIIYAHAYLVKTKARENKDKPTKVVVKYVKEESDWLIEGFIFNNRKNTAKGINTSIVIDEFN